MIRHFHLFVTSSDTCLFLKGFHHGNGVGGIWDDRIRRGRRGIAGEMQKYRSADVGHTPHRPRPDKEGGRPLGSTTPQPPGDPGKGLAHPSSTLPFPPTLNWLVDKSPTLSGGGGGGIGKSTMRRCRRFDKGGRPVTGFLQAGARPADRSPKVQGYCSCQSVKLLVSRFSRAGA